MQETHPVAGPVDDGFRVEYRPQAEGRSLVEVVAWEQEHAVRLPLKALTTGAAVPNCRGAATLDNVDDLVEGQTDWRQDSLWRHLANAGLGDALLTFELNEGRAAVRVSRIARQGVSDYLC